MTRSSNTGLRALTAALMVSLVSTAVALILAPGAAASASVFDPSRALSSPAATATTEAGAGTNKDCADECPTYIPDFTGLTRDRAIGLANVRGLAVVFSTDVDPTCNHINLAVQQSLQPGTEVPTGSTVTVYLGVPAAGSACDFSITLSPQTGGVLQGHAISTTIGLAAVSGFTGTPGLTIEGLPSGVTASFAPATLSAQTRTSTLTLTTSPITPLGRYRVTIATDLPLRGAGKTVTYQLTVLAPDFSIALTLTSGSVVPNGTVTTEVNLTAINGFNGNASLSIKGLPAGVTASFAPATISTGDFASTLTFTASPNATPGTFEMTIAAISPLLGPNKAVIYQLTISEGLPSS